MTRMANYLKSIPIFSRRFSKNSSMTMKRIKALYLVAIALNNAVYNWGSPIIISILSFRIAAL